MARNQEKSQSMLNRFLQAKRAPSFTPKETRPRIASEVSTIPTAEKWRRQVISEISRRIEEIQDGSIGEPRIRQLNDEINRLIQEKKSWEFQIQNLGGKTYADDVEDDTVVKGHGGYLYFGAAKELTAVKEMLKKGDVLTGKQRKPDQERWKLQQRVDAAYYGFFEEDDNFLEDESLAEAALGAER